ncbi:MAG: hypothetical protein K1X29_10190 [Bdellovibrionales bacterium]|nr:hypothetical protein [Bdellovibrionales bacterium]
MKNQSSRGQKQLGLGRIVMLSSIMFLLGCNGAVKFTSPVQLTSDSASVDFPVVPDPGVVVPDPEEPTEPPETPTPPVVVDPPVTPPVVVEPPPAQLPTPPVVVAPPPFQPPVPPVLVEPPVSPPVVIEPPVIPPVVVEPPAEVEPPVVSPPSYEFKSGICASEGTTPVTSCMTCQTPSVGESNSLSHKAEQLLEIMTLSCPIPNKSEPDHYVAPTKKELLQMLHRCTPEAYQDTVASEEQSRVLQQLLDPVNSSLRQKMFKGLWYHLPQHKSFETYFGLEIHEAVQVMCYHKYNVKSVHDLGGQLLPAEYFEAPVPWLYQMPAEYEFANRQIRPELYHCMMESLAYPINKFPDPSEIQCRYETLRGPFGERMEAQIENWLNQGFKVGVDVPESGLCKDVTDLEQIKDLHDNVLAGAYVCEVR